MSKFELLRDHQYYYDEELATISFNLAGKPVAVAQMQTVGSYSTASKSWMWSWANESSSEPAYKLLLAVKDFGDCHGIQELSTGSWSTPEDIGWKMTAATVELLNGIGAYRCKSAHLWIYFGLLGIGPP
jgi:hypothetical protein